MRQNLGSAFRQVCIHQSASELSIHGWLPYRSLRCERITLTGASSGKLVTANLSKHQTQILLVWGIALLLGAGGGGCVKKTPPSSSPSTATATTTATAKNAPGDVSMSAQNAQILQEMIRVTWLRDPPSQAEFVAWVQALDEGASLEGVYNGLVHSAYYRKLEQLDEKPKPALQKRFLMEMIELVRSTGLTFSWQQFDREPQGEFVGISNSTETTPSAQPLENVVSLSKSDFENKEAQAAFVKFFEATGFHVMKRTLAKTALTAIDELQKQGKLAEWYAAWSAQQAASPVDFGIAERKNALVEFHLKWAKARLQSKNLERGLDQIRWEVLNRLHRVLNQEQP